MQKKVLTYYCLMYLLSIQLSIEAGKRMQKTSRLKIQGETPTLH